MNAGTDKGGSSAIASSCVPGAKDVGDRNDWVHLPSQLRPKWVVESMHGDPNFTPICAPC